MSQARNEIHERCCTSCGPANDQCLQLYGLLNRVEDDRAHAEAQKLIKRGEELKAGTWTQGVGMAMAAMLIVEAIAMDPYEMRDGQLVRKADGQPVVL
jgi:hypothetical protein